MWDNCIESVSRVESGSKGFGCILAHLMGMGKTLQVEDLYIMFFFCFYLFLCISLICKIKVITFVEALLREKIFSHVLIVAPVNTIQNWIQEFDKWLPGSSFTLFVVEVLDFQSFPLLS